MGAASLHSSSVSSCSSTYSEEAGGTKGRDEVGTTSPASSTPITTASEEAEVRGAEAAGAEITTPVGAQHAAPLRMALQAETRSYERVGFDRLLAGVPGCLEWTTGEFEHEVRAAHGTKTALREIGLTGACSITAVKPQRGHHCSLFVLGRRPGASARNARNIQAAGHGEYLCQHKYGSTPSIVVRWMPSSNTSRRKSYPFTSASAGQSSPVG